MKASLLYADPPWLYSGDPNKMGAAGKHYAMMSQDELAALPIRELLADKGALLLWTTGPRMPEAIDLIRRWGLHYRNVAYVWVKTNLEGDVIGAQGPPATFVKQNAEYVLFASVEDPVEYVLLATSNKAGRPFKIQDFAQAQMVFARKKGHSVKPKAIHKRIEKICGDVPKLELFGREKREGWTVLGNEIDGKDIAMAIQEFLDA